MRQTILLAALLAAAHAIAAPAASAPAANPRLDGVKQIERNACVRAGNTGPGAPRNLKLVPKYCECVSSHYWNGVPQAEVDELMNNGQSAAIDRKKDERLAAARSACQVK